MSEPDDNPLPAPPRLEDQLCFALHAASRAITRSYRPLLEGLGITYTQYITLMVLWEEDGVGVRELGQRLRLDSGTLTPLLKRLERDGFITRRRNPEDERKLLVYLTDKGTELSRDGARIHRELRCQLGDHEAELGALKQQLDDLRALLEKGWGSPD